MDRRRPRIDGDHSEPAGIRCRRRRGRPCGPITRRRTASSQSSPDLRANAGYQSHARSSCCGPSLWRNGPAQCAGASRKRASRALLSRDHAGGPAYARAVARSPGRASSWSMAMTHLVAWYQQTRSGHDQAARCSTGAALTISGTQFDVIPFVRGTSAARRGGWPNSTHRAGCRRSCAARCRRSRPRTGRSGADLETRRVWVSAARPFPCRRCFIRPARTAPSAAVEPRVSALRADGLYRWCAFAGAVSPLRFPAWAEGHQRAAEQAQPRGVEQAREGQRPPGGSA